MGYVSTSDVSFVWSSHLVGLWRPRGAGAGPRAPGRAVPVQRSQRCGWFEAHDPQEGEGRDPGGRRAEAALVPPLSPAAPVRG